MTLLHDLLSGFRGLILLCIFDFGTRIVSGAPATSGIVGIEIGDGQIQFPVPLRSVVTSTLSFQHAVSLSNSHEATITTLSQTTLFSNSITTEPPSTTTSIESRTSEQNYALLESAIFYVAHESRPNINQPGSFPNSSASSSVSTNFAGISSNHAASLVSTSIGDIYSSRTISKPAFVTQSSTSSVPALPSLACTKFLFFPGDGPNSFVCQCNDGTWNHRKAQESYSECPSQITSTALTTTTATVALPSTVSCTLVVFAPGSLTWGPPFCECSNDLLFLGSCPVSVSAQTTTLTLSEPVTPGANAIPTLTTDPSAAVCTEVPSLSIKCVAPPTQQAVAPPVAIPPPSPTTAACTPRCTTVLGAPREEGNQLIFCHCNPACGGYPYPTPNGNGDCPYQVN